MSFSPRLACAAVASAKRGVSFGRSGVLMSSPFNAAHLGAMVAAIHLAAGFHTVADDVAITVVALRRERVDRAFETVERMALTVSDDLKRLVVIVPANFTPHHGSLSFARVRDGPKNGPPLRP